MGNQFRVEVRESCEELQHRLRHAVTGATKERVQMLYWLKTKAIRLWRLPFGQSLQDLNCHKD